jgi:hypothetical protein
VHAGVGGDRDAGRARRTVPDRPALKAARLPRPRVSTATSTPVSTTAPQPFRGHSFGRQCGDVDLHRPDPTCPWLVRDLGAWRRGVLLTASADLLSAWQATLRCLHPRTRATAARRYGQPVDSVCRARLTGDTHALSAACRALLDAATDQPPTRPLRTVLQRLREDIAVADDPAPCLLAHDAPTSACTSSRGSRAAVTRAIGTRTLVRVDIARA